MKPTAHSFAQSLPPVFLHVLLALLQVGLLTLLCALAGVFTDTDSTHEYLGHLMPGALIAGVGIPAMIAGFSERQQTRLEGWLGVLAMAVYLTGDIIEHPPAGIFADLDHAGNEHIGILMLIGAAGLFALVLARRLADLRGFQVILVIALLGLLLPSHVHPGAAALQVLSHQATGALLLLGAVFRFFGRPVEFGASLVCAAYVFFSGQTGLPPLGEAIGQTPISWVCYWAGLGLLVAGSYLLIFRRPLAPA